MDEVIEWRIQMSLELASNKYSPDDIIDYIQKLEKFIFSHELIE